MVDGGWWMIWVDFVCNDTHIALLFLSIELTILIQHDNNDHVKMRRRLLMTAYLPLLSVPIYRLDEK